VYQFLFIFGLDRTLAANAALLLAATPMLTALLSAVLGHERVGRPVWIGVIATFVGIGLVIAGGGERLTWRGGTLAGDLLMLGSSVAWSVYTVGARGPIARYGSVTVTAWTLWIGTIFIVLAGLPDLFRLEWGAVSALAWGSTAYAGLLGIGLAYLMWYRGVGKIGNTRTAVYGNLVPVVALPTAWLLLGEVPGAWQLVGAAVIIGGVTLARLRA
jgi:drug/metabolite transporter (DMT)-like permease